MHTLCHLSTLNEVQLVREPSNSLKFYFPYQLEQMICTKLWVPWKCGNSFFTCIGSPADVQTSAVQPATSQIGPRFSTLRFKSAWPPCDEKIFPLRALHPYPLCFVSSRLTLSPPLQSIKSNCTPPHSRPKDNVRILKNVSVLSIADRRQRRMGSTGGAAATSAPARSPTHQLPPLKQIRFVNNEGQPPPKRRRINAA